MMSPMSLGFIMGGCLFIGSAASITTADGLMAVGVYLMFISYNWKELT